MVPRHRSVDAVVREGWVGFGLCAAWIVSAIGGSVALLWLMERMAKR